MYISRSETYSYRSPFGSGFYLRGKPGPLDRWAINRMTAPRARYYFQNTIATLAVLGLLTWLNIALWRSSWIAGTIITILTAVCAFVSLFFAIEEGEWVVASAYSALAAIWLDRGSFQKRLIAVDNSLPLRMLAGQYCEDKVSGFASLETTISWLKGHPGWIKKIDALLDDTWVKATEKTLAENADSKDPVVAAKLVDLRTRLQERAWQLTLEFLREDRTKAMQEEERKLTDLDACLDAAPATRAGEWQQPSTTEPVVKNPNLR